MAKRNLARDRGGAHTKYAPLEQSLYLGPVREIVELSEKKGIFALSFAFVFFWCGLFFLCVRA